MLRMLKTNPRRNPSLRWTEQMPPARSPKGLKFEHTDALLIPQITITHPRLGSVPAGTGLFQGYIEGGMFKPRGGAPLEEYYADFHIFLPYEVAANPNNIENLKTARVGFSPSRMGRYPGRSDNVFIGRMYKVGDREIAQEYMRAEGNLFMIGDESEFATLEEAKAWIQSKVDVLSRLTLERPSGY